MEVDDAPGMAPAGVARRAAAVALNAAVLAVVAVLALRFVAGIVQEPIPASIARADACAVLGREEPTAWCSVRGDRVYYSTHEHPLLRVGGVVLGASFANSVVATWATGTSLGKRLLNLRVCDQATGDPPGFRVHLLRWMLWPVTSFGATVVHRDGGSPSDFAPRGAVTAPPATVAHPSSATMAPAGDPVAGRDPLFTEGT